MNFLLTADIHLTDSARDAVRFRLFPWLAKQQEIHKVDATFILGDITHHKDRHSSSLVNQVVEGLVQLQPPVYIGMGNHDYIRDDLPFFKFLSNIDGITFCSELTLLHKYKAAIIPHQPDQAAFDTALKRVPECWHGFCHQTLTGAIGDTGGRLTGLTVPHRAGKLYSGDVHTPHVCENVTYIGSPYHTRHGIDYKPRVLLLKDGKEENLYFDAPKKLSLTIRDISEIPKLKKGDQVKIVMELARSEAVEWENHKKDIIDHCKQNGIEVYGLRAEVAQPRRRARLIEPSKNKSNLDYFQAFCVTEQLPAQIKTAGKSFIGDTNG
jgi:hypothetical protein